jgi:4-amino-4-deoxy-L-arabinose transferase-like glycosyltransferase
MTPSVPPAPRLRRLLVALIVLATLLVGSTWSVFSHTWDEPEHLAAGLSLLDRFRYEYDIQHPPLGRVMIATGPYLLGAHSVGKPPPDGRPEGDEILYGQGHYREFLTAARAGVLPFLWLLSIVTFGFARRAGLGDPGALAAVGFLLTAPPVLGHAGLATLDVPAVATTLWATYALMRWLEGGGRRAVLHLGLAGGVAVATKLSAIPFLGLALPAVLVADAIAAHRPPRIEAAARRFSELLGAALLAFVVVTLSYGGRWKYFTDARHPFNQALYFLFGNRGEAHDLAYEFAAKVPLPESLQLLLGGVQALEVHNRNGHLSYLLGETHASGWWYFYLVALAVKTPLPLLLLGLAGLVLGVVDGYRQRRTWLVLPAVLFMVLLAFVSGFSHINIGVRHVLILYPLLSLGAAYTAVLCVRRALRIEPAPRYRLAGLAAVVVLCVWQVVGLVLAYPDYLAYFNETVRHPERVLVDSDLDWGQDLGRLERRLKELGVDRLSFGYLGSADLAREDLPPTTRLTPHVPATGWIAVTALARAYGGGAYDWLDGYRPVERVGKTIDLYYIDAQRPVPAAGADGGH